MQSPIKRKRRRRRSAQPNAVAAIWLLAGSVFILAAVMVQSLTAIIACGTAGLCSMAVGTFSLYHPEKVGAVPAKPAKPHKTTKPGKTPSPSPPRPAPGTARPTSAGTPCGCRAGKRCPGVGKCQCKRCRGAKTASKPTPHDPPRLSPNDDGSLNWLRSPEAKRLERRVVRQERRRQRETGG